MSDIRRSILWQLPKYTPPPKPERVVDVPSSPPLQTVPDVDVALWSDVLYPKRLWDAYEAVRVRHHSVSEQACDMWLSEFMANTDKPRYLATYTQAVTPYITLLLMLRVLVASYGEDQEHAGGNLPQSYQPIAIGALGLEGSVPYTVALAMLERASKIASHEDLILGRIGYLMVWQNKIDPRALLPKGMRAAPLV